MRVENATRGTVIGDRIRIARNTRDRTVGLLDRHGLADGEGLWIERSPSIHMFFMRFPIDAVFVNASPPCRRRSSPTSSRGGSSWWARGARDCLELWWGRPPASGTESGDELRLTVNKTCLDLTGDGEAVDLLLPAGAQDRIALASSVAVVVMMSSTTTPVNCGGLGARSR